MVDDVAATKKIYIYKLLLKTSFVVENVVCTSETKRFSSMTAIIISMKIFRTHSGNLHVIITIFSGTV
jgi:hypothetical protein